ncbi:hypothetical protein [Paeniglutamicibacter kerguelensis]|uniref:Uncharacterized protein n=1 Tax=Paeniglutamicibacter kerguelensis TaxID=254788 RepID=A0ABS4XGR1_9MICC|nr:hypothetical protein [Paeniglutamicibacter kerguelensis]MBP2387664.1 hypothetical protein [Paeniglutamicibacter kerguelensis]
MSFAVVVLGDADGLEGLDDATGLEALALTVGAGLAMAVSLGDWMAEVLPGTGGSAGAQPLKAKPSKPASKTVAWRADLWWRNTLTSWVGIRGHLCPR